MHRENADQVEVDGAKHDHHPHTHNQDHEHNERHNHEHGGGIVGWLRHTFAHSHDVQDKVDDAMESNERGLWATRIALISLAVTTGIQIFIYWLSGSTALFADTIHNFGDGANSIPLLIAFHLQRRSQSRKFTYGYGRTEDVAGLIIVALIAVSAMVAGYESIMKLIDPEPVTHLWYVAAAAIVGFIGNEIVAFIQMRAGREIGSAALVADGQHALIDGFTSLAVIVAVIGIAIGLPILDPIIGLIITATILFILKDAGASVFRRMLDGIEPEILEQIEHAPTHIDGVRDVHEVRARWLGHRVQTELHISVDPHLSVAESHTIVEGVQDALRDHVPALGGATIHVCPAGQ